MYQHAVPRQITSFEFKLVGFMTIKQFVYLLITTGFAAIIYFIIPIKFVNVALALICVALGAMFTFYKYNERSLDAWIINLYRAITKPSRFVYVKNNKIPDFLSDVYLSSDDVTTQHHIDASEKLLKYETSKIQANASSTIMQKQNITKLIIQQKDNKPLAVPMPQSVIDVVAGYGAGIPISPTPASNPLPETLAQSGAYSQVQTLPDPTSQNTTTYAAPTNTTPLSSTLPQQMERKQPFISGVVYNSRNETLPNIMVYINTAAGQTVRILKTNHKGIFATFHPLPSGDYVLNPKDLNATYFFDTMNVPIDGATHEPITIFSKELL